MALRCCHPKALLLCPHPCPSCGPEEARQMAASLRAFERKTARDEYTDTSEALDLLRRARLLLAQIGRGG